MEQHHSRIRAQLSLHRGVELDTVGDGFFVRFDGPARAIRDSVKDLVAGSGIEFQDRGGAELKGLPGELTLYAVAAVA